MEAGKTAAACAIISRMRHRGLVIDAFKATGVSLRRDILAMEDAGARRSAIFTDLGIVTTTRANGPALTRTMLTELAAGKPDVIVFELGDGTARHLRRGRHPGVPRHPRRAHRRRALGQRSGRRLGRREAAARALRDRAVRGHRTLPPTTRSAWRSSAADEGAGLQCDEHRRGARRPRHRGRRPRAANDARRAGRARTSDPSRRSCSAAPATWPASCCACSPRIRASSSPAVLSDSQPGEPVAQGLPASRQRLWPTRASSRRRRSGARCRAAPRMRGVLRRAARRCRRADRLAAASSPSPAGTRPAGRRHLRRLPLSARRRPTSRSTSTRTARPARLRGVHLRGAGAPGASSTRRTWRIRAASPPRRCSPSVPLLTSG